MTYEVLYMVDNANDIKFEKVVVDLKECFMTSVHPVTWVVDQLDNKHFPANVLIVKMEGFDLT